MNKQFNLLVIFFILLLSFVPIISAQETDNIPKNPILHADVPDPSVIRVDDTYYMSSTTMHMNPGVPIMKSKDLVNWEIVNYVYDILADNSKLALRNGQDAYGNGSWASSLRYHDDYFYVAFSSQSTGHTYIYKTKDIENGPWTRSVLPFFHDMSLLFDDDGRVYLVHGGTNINITELTEDATAVKPGGLNRVIIRNAGKVAGSDFIINAEGAHVHKIDGKYYIFLITWPQGSGRTQIVYRSDRITGPYEGKVVLRDSGIAQGGIVDTPDGDWYSILFQDHGAVGRIPYLIPVAWKNKWPIFGDNGSAPDRLDIPVDNLCFKIVASDEFGESELPLVWQWNHNPVDEYWSLTERPGYLRLINDRIDKSVVETRNTLTQRTFGPRSSGIIAVDTSNMKDGDVAGLAAFQKNYAYVGVKKTGNSKSIVMVNASSDSPVEVQNIPVDQDRVYFKIEFDFRFKKDEAYFFYSLDGEEWTRIGNILKMTYTLPHFMGYRFALFNYATKSTGGYVDFDYFKVKDTIEHKSWTFF